MFVLFIVLKKSAIEDVLTDNQQQEKLSEAWFMPYLKRGRRTN